MNRIINGVCASTLCSLWCSARDIQAEIRAADRFGSESRDLVTRNEVRTFWSENESSMIFRVNHERGKHSFHHLDLKTGEQSPAFDHELLAKALSAATSSKVRPDELPLEFVETLPSGVRFKALGKGWLFDPGSGAVKPVEVSPRSAPMISPEEAMKERRPVAGSTELTFENATGGEVELFWVEGRNQWKSYGKLPPGKTLTQHTYSGHAWVVADASGSGMAGVVARDTPSVARITGRVEAPPQRREDVSADGRWRAFFKDHNVFIQSTTGAEAIRLSSDGSQANSYLGPLAWSPDSKKLVVYRANDVAVRKVTIVQSSPADQLQPKVKVIDYPKPGDEIHQPKPCLFNVDQKVSIPVDDGLFANPWEIRDGEWTKDSSEYQFVYNQRGHQVMRIVGIRGDSGSTRTIHEERSATFIDYSQKYEFRRIRDGKEFLWASEKSGYNHLYRIDAASGRVLNAVTRGAWNVKEIVEMDESAEQLVLKICGVPGSDPYHQHYARVGFDGKGFMPLTSSDGDHSIEFSPGRKWISATWSRVDQPPVTEIRNAETGKRVAEINRADDSALLKTGWSRPERFSCKGRDGKTDIHGIIIRPRNFDPSQRYPVLEDIYAGPHDFFVPKRYSTWLGGNAMAEHGFVVVKIDGMGTNWRSKAFHDVAWKNLKDSGFPDRILWIKAAAADRPWMDLGRMGIYGGSAGGQSAMAALLHHGDFYKVAVADCGCHDNRMDKIWWNEAWMGWPVDESYAANSNVVNAPKLQGNLLLIVGELDENVDPASTAQVAAALQKAGKRFDYLPLMNAGHGAAESPYGRFRRADFLVRHLQP